MDIRLERIVRSLAAAGHRPTRRKCGLGQPSQRNADRAKDDVKAELIVDRIATAENIDINDEELNHETRTCSRSIAANPQKRCTLV